MNTHLSKRLINIKEISNANYKISIRKTGTIYSKYPNTPYQTDTFVIKDNKKNIIYEIYGVNIKGEYEIVEIIKIISNRVVNSAIRKDDEIKILIKEVSSLLEKIEIA